MLKHLDLFSGIGGFSLALESTGKIETVGFVEKDEFAQSIIKKHWPNVKLMGDIYDVEGTEFGEIDIITGGFPCQPFSIAGKRKGTGDDRFLWPEMLRIIDKAKPNWVIGENVANFVRMELGRAVSDLEAIGYSVWPFVIPACAVDAKHRRDRVWIVANGSCIGQKGGRSDRFKKSRGDARKETSGCNSTGSGRSNGETKPGLGRMVNGVSHWLDEPGINRVTDMTKNRAKRIKALGNAIVPQIAYQIAKAIVENVRG